MSFSNQLLMYHKNDFSSNELEVIRVYFNTFLNRLLENDNTLMYMNNIPCPDQMSTNESLQSGFDALEEKGLTRGDSLLARTYLYYEAYVSKTSKYSNYICNFLEYFKKNAQTILRSEIYNNKAFMGQFKALNNKEIVFLLFLLNDLNYIKLTWGFPQSIHPNEPYYGNLKVNEITDEGSTLLRGRCINKKFKDLISFSEKIKEDYLDEDYNNVYIKILASVIDNSQKKWLVNYLRFDFVIEEENNFPQKSYSTDKKAILFQEIIELDNFFSKFQNNGCVYESGDYQFYLHENFSIPTNYNDFKKQFNTNNYQYHHIQCKYDINFIFMNSLYSPNLSSYYNDVLDKYYFYGERRLHGMKILQKILGISTFMDSAPEPIILFIFPIISFKFEYSEKTIDSEKYLEILWNINGKLKNLIYITIAKGKEDPKKITENPIQVKIEDNFKGDIHFGIYWLGIDDLLKQDSWLFVKTISFYKVEENKFINTQNLERKKPHISVIYPEYDEKIKFKLKTNFYTVSPSYWDSSGMKFDNKERFFYGPVPGTEFPSILRGTGFYIEEGYYNEPAVDSFVNKTFSKFPIKFQEGFKYDFALSFAGEDRELVEIIAKELILNDSKIFYDNFSKEELVGKDLSTYFKNTYGKSSKYVVIFISKNYEMKEWTNFEFEIARDEAKLRKEEFILPVRLDNTILHGIKRTIGYINFRSEGIFGTISILLKKINKSYENSNYKDIEKNDSIKKIEMKYQIKIPQ